MLEESEGLIAFKLLSILTGFFALFIVLATIASGGFHMPSLPFNPDAIRVTKDMSCVCETAVGATQNNCRCWEISHGKSFDIMVW